MNNNYKHTQQNEKERADTPILKAAFGIGMFLATPLVLIWSVNTIFGTSLPITFQTWLAFIALFVVSYILKFVFTSDH